MAGKDVIRPRDQIDLARVGVVYRQRYSGLVVVVQRGVERYTVKFMRIDPLLVNAGQLKRAVLVGRRQAEQPVVKRRFHIARVHRQRLVAKRSGDFEALINRVALGVGVVEFDQRTKIKRTQIWRAIDQRVRDEEI